MKYLLQTKIDELVKILANMSKLENNVQIAVEIISNALAHNKKILLCGNGGSAAEAQHIAAEYINELSSHNRRGALPAIALTTDSSVITSISNDRDYEEIFSRQIEALGNKEDVLMAISTSGNSPNIIQAINSAKEKQLYVIGFTGASGGKMANLCDVLFKVKSLNTMRIQEGHLFLEHIIVELVERRINYVQI